MVTPKKVPLSRGDKKKTDSSSSEESEELDHTISPKTQFFPARISTPYPPPKKKKTFPRKIW